MLNSLSIISYYGFIRTYWTAKQNAARTNIDLAFTRTALSALVKHQTDNDTTANQALLDTEAAAQSAFLTATQGNRAGVVTADELATSLATYKTAKASRRAAIPNCQAITDSITQQAQETFELFQLQYNNKVNAKPFFGQDAAAHQSELDTYKSYLIYAQSLRDIATDFAEKLNAYVTMSEQKLDVIETTGKAPETYQDIIDASNYSFDGTYSDAVNHIAPTGQLYGQTTIIQKVEHLYWWAGEKWYRIPDEVDQAASVALLPTGRPFGEIFRVPRYVAASNSYIWDYYCSTGDGWELMNEYWEIDGVNNLPALGYTVGDYHKVIERAVPVIWTGFEYERQRISAFVDDIGLEATTIQLRGDHNELLESFTGFESNVTQSFSGVAGDISTLEHNIDAYSDDANITLAESNILKLNINRLVAGSTNMISVAGGLELVTEAGNYQTALAALTTELNKWINQTTYPKAITANDRATIKTLFEAVENTEATLINAISAKHGDNAYTSAAFDVSQFRLVYDGFVRGFTPELKLVFISQNELSLQPNYSDFDYLTVNEQNIQASKRTSVFTFTPVLSWNEETQSLYTATLQPDTEYWVYLANRDDRFQEDVPGGVYDYRGRLFCSYTEPSSNYLGESGLGLHALLIGKVETDSSSKFRHELDVSLISRQSDTKETFREFSDFDLEYVDENTLALQRNYGTYGQIYIPESLYYIGENREVYTTSPRIEVDVNENLVYDVSAIAANTLYYVYIAADSDVYNFNEINETTNRPWHPEDSDPTPSLYDADKDFRLWMFLSTKEPEEGRLAETYAGFWARHIGQVRTDATGKFIYSGGVSAIRQATLQPEYFDGLAEITILDVSTTTFKIIRKRGTSGIVMVGSKGTLTYDADNPLVHSCATADTVYTYTESNPSSPLSSTGTILDLYIGREKYLYLANDNNCWDSLKNRTFLCDIEPTDAYLSQNFPGNNARWICTVNLAAGTKGAELVTNSNFEDADDWDGHSGWGWSELNLNAYHNTGNTSSLDQNSMTVVAGGTYEIIFTTSAISAGSLTPKLGNTNGTAVISAGLQTQYIIATNTDVLKFVPTTDFNGAVDMVSCKKVEHGAFTGSYLVDSIAKSIVTIDDTIVSSSAAWSSAKIMQIVTDYLGYGAAIGSFIAEKTGGLNVRLEYVDATTIRLIPHSGADTPVIFEDGSSIIVPAAGFAKTVSGAANARYYVYLRASTESPLLISSSPPNNLYTKLETLGTANIQVGDICMTSTNAMSGAWNVCSSHQETSQQWSTPINAASVTTGQVGLITNLRCNTLAISRTGTTTAVGYLYCAGQHKDTEYTSVTLGSNTNSSLYFSTTAIYGTYVGSGSVSVTVALALDTPAGGISNSGSYSESSAGWVTECDYVSCSVSSSISARDGNLVITRS